jgi:hypothetical protein
MLTRNPYMPHIFYQNGYWQVSFSEHCVSHETENGKRNYAAWKFVDYANHAANIKAGLYSLNHS